MSRITCIRRDIDANDGLRFIGYRDYKTVHRLGILHLTTQILVSRSDDEIPEVLVHRRSKDRSVGANLIDIPGGHVDMDSHSQMWKWDDPDFLRRLSLRAALSEIHEEVEFARPVSITESHLQMFGRLGQFSASTVSPSGVINNERSSVYILQVERYPQVVSVREKRSDGHIDRTTPMWLTLDNLLASYQDDPSRFSDGISRLLQFLSENCSTVYDLKNKLK